MFCRQQVAQLRDAIPTIHSHGAELIVIGNGTPEQARHFAEGIDLETPLYTDPELATYAALGMSREISKHLAQLPGTIGAAWKTWRQGFRQGAVLGDAMQLGGVLVVTRGGEVVFEHRSRHPGDHPSTRHVLEALRQVSKA
jgi:hypothetical protein